jgi:hypothetical protein
MEAGGSDKTSSTPMVPIMPIRIVSAPEVDGFDSGGGIFESF